MLGDVPNETVTALVVCHGVQPPSWPMTTPSVNGVSHGDPRSLTRGRRRRVNELGSEGPFEGTIATKSVG